MPRRYSTTWPAWGAFWWGMLFGLWNLYWSIGGEFGLEWLAQSIQEGAREGDTMLLIANTIGGLAKIAAGLLALATIARWDQPISRRLHLGLLYAGGALLILYGGVNWTQMFLAETGRIDVPGSIEDEPLRWYLFLWEPLWIIGGALLVLTAIAYQKRR